MIPAKYWSPTKKLMVLGAMAGGKLVEDTATGNPLTFITDKAKPLKSLLIPFTPQQEGTGDPSPENIRSILPWNGLTVLSFAENLLNINSTGKTQSGMSYTTVEKGGKRVAVRVSGETTGNNSFFNLNYVSAETLSILPGNYKAYGYTEKVGFRVYYIDANGAQINALITDVPEPVNTFTIPTDAKCSWMRLQAAPNVQIDELIYPILIPADEPITETDISFPSPVYGGSAEIVSGAMMQTILFVSAKWKDFEGNTSYTDTISKDLVIPYDCLYGSAGNGKTLCNIAKYKYNNDDDPHFYLTNSKRIRCFMPKDMDGETEITFACTLAEPISLESIEPQQITALLGNNTMWSDADGSMTAVYLKKG